MVISVNIIVQVLLDVDVFNEDENCVTDGIKTQLRVLKEFLDKFQARLEGLHTIVTQGYVLWLSSLCSSTLCSQRNSKGLHFSNKTADEAKHYTTSHFDKQNMQMQGYHLYRDGNYDQLGDVWPIGLVLPAQRMSNSRNLAISKARVWTLDGGVLTRQQTGFRTHIGNV